MPTLYVLNVCMYCIVCTKGVYKVDYRGAAAPKKREK